MTQYIGEKNLLAISQETVYGTYVDTGQKVIPVINLSNPTDPVLAERKDANVGSIFGEPPLPTRLSHAFNYAFRLYPGDEIGFWFWQMFAAAATSGAGADKTHVWTLNEAALAEKSLSLETTKAGVYTDDFAGAMVNEFTISGGTDSYIQCTVAGASQSRVSGAQMGSIVIPATKPYRYFNAKVYYDSAEIKVNSWQINWNLALRLENFKQGQTIEKPVLNGRPVVNASFEVDLANTSYRTLFEAGTPKQLKVVLTHSDDIPTTATKYQVVLELPQFVITSRTDDGDTGQIPEAISGEGYKGTSEGANTTSLELTVVNDTVSYV